MTTEKNAEKKTGRADKAIVQLSREELDALRERAHIEGLGVSAYVRRLILKDAGKQHIES